MGFILSQICGIIACIFICWGYSVKSKPRFLAIQIIANFLLAMSFLFVCAWSGAVIAFFAVVRCVFLFFSNTHNINSRPYLPLFCVIYVIAGIIFWQHWFDFMPIVYSILFTIAYFCKNLKTVKIISMPATALIIVYAFISRAYTSAICASIELIILIINIIEMMHSYSKNHNQEH